MNKSELIAAVAAKTELTKKDTEKFVDAFIEAVGDTVASGKKVQLIGFGTFERRQRTARTGRNPRTGASIKIPAAYAPAFKPGKALKDKVGKTKPKKSSKK